MSWHGYFLIRFDATQDANQADIQTAIEKTGNNPYRESDGRIKSYTRRQPHLITHHRKDVLGRGYIVEQVRDAVPTQANITSVIASELGVPQAVVDLTVATWQVFSGTNREQRRDATITYIVANSADWEEEI